MGGIEKTVCSECDVGGASGVFWRLAIRKISQGGQLVFFHEVVILLKWFVGKLFKKITNDLANSGGLEVMRMEGLRFVLSKLLDVSSKHLVPIVRFAPTNRPHQATPYSRTGIDHADELFGVMEESGQKVEIILFSRSELFEWCEFDDGNDLVFLQRIPNDIDSRMEEAIGLDCIKSFCNFVGLRAACRVVLNPGDGGVKLVWGILDTVPDDACVGKAGFLTKQLPILLFSLILSLASGFFVTLGLSSTINHIMFAGKFPPKSNQIIQVVVITTSTRAVNQVGIARKKDVKVSLIEFEADIMIRETLTFVFLTPLLPDQGRAGLG